MNRWWPIYEQVVANLLAWPHTGFGAHLSREIPADPVSRENVARYLAHPPIVLDRILGDPSAGKVIYTGEAIHPRHRANFRVFAPLAFLAELCVHIPDPHEKTAIYYGWYSNRTRGFRKARGLLVPAGPDVPVPDTDRAPLALRRTWARLIRKIYEVDPLLCTRCGATMKVIAVIEDDEVIYRILSHLKLLSPGDGPRAPPRPEPVEGPSKSVISASPASAGLRDLIYEPVFDDLPQMEPAPKRCPVPSASRGCTEDEGRPFGVALQGEAPNRHERLGSKAPVVSVMDKAGAPVRWWMER